VARRPESTLDGAPRREDTWVEHRAAPDRFRPPRDPSKEASHEHYEGATGTAPSLTLRRIVKPGEAWIVEGTIDYGDGTPVSLVSILEADADGKIVRATDYFANPFEAPEWRRQWVEQTDPARAG